MNIADLEKNFRLRKDAPNDARRTFVPGAVKGIDSQKRQIRAYASTNAWDRYGERFEADAFKDGLAHFKKNPVILFAHQYDMEPIGKAIGYEFDAKGLILTMEFADTAKAKEIFALYEGGFMSAFSVGFRPLEYRFEERVAGSGEMGAVFVKAELLENSAVPVPANPEAVVIKGLSGKTMTLSPDALGDILARAYRTDKAFCSKADGEVPPAEAAPEAAPAAAPEAAAPPAEAPAVSAAGMKSMMACSEHLEEAMKICDQMMNSKAADASMMELHAHLSAAKVECDSAMGKTAPNVAFPKSLKYALGYLISLGKAARANGKVEDDAVRSLLIQANNVCRELVYGVAAESLDGMDAQPTPAEIDALVREYEVLSEKIAKDPKANPKDIADFMKLGEDIAQLIKGNKL